MQLFSELVFAGMRYTLHSSTSLIWAKCSSWMWREVLFVLFDSFCFHLSEIEHIWNNSVYHFAVLYVGNINWSCSICLLTGSAALFRFLMPVFVLSLYMFRPILVLLKGCSLIVCKCDCLTDSCCLRNYCKPKWDTIEYMQSLVTAKNSKPLKAWLYSVFPRSERYVYFKGRLK